MSCNFNLKISHLKKQNVYVVRSSTLDHSHMETPNNLLERAIEAAISDNIEPESSAPVENFVEELVNDCQKLGNNPQLQMHFDDNDTLPDSTADIEDGAFNQPGGVESDSPKTAKEETDTDSIQYLESRLKEGQIFTSTHEFETLFKEYCAKTYTHFKILSAHYDRLSQEDRDMGLFARKHFTCIENLRAKGDLAKVNKGMRKRETKKVGCNFFLKIHYNAKQKYYRVQSCNLEHSHERSFYQYFTSPLGRRLTDEELERYSPMIMDTVKRGKKSMDKKSLDKNSTTQPNKISTQKLKELIQSETGKLLTTKDLSNLKMKIMKGREKQGEESKESNMDQSHYQEEIQDAWLHGTW